MAKSKKKYHKRSNYRTSNNVVKQNKNVYTDDYNAKREYLNSEKPIWLRLFVVALACVVFLGFVILPLIK